MPLIGYWLMFAQLALATASLLGIVVGAVKVINRNEAEWRAKELAMATLQSDVANLKIVHVDLAALKVQLSELMSEVTRVRDRLDHFLDSGRQ